MSESENSSNIQHSKEDPIGTKSKVRLKIKPKSGEAKQLKSSKIQLNNLKLKINKLNDSWETRFTEMQAQQENAITSHDTKITKMNLKLKTLKSRLKLGAMKIKTIETKVVGFVNQNDENKLTTSDHLMETTPVQEPKKKKSKKVHPSELSTSENLIVQDIPPIESDSDFIQDPHGQDDPETLIKRLKHLSEGTSDETVHSQDVQEFLPETDIAQTETMESAIGPKKYYCKLCPKVFIRKSKFKSHIRFDHSNKSMEKPKCLEVSINHPKPVKTRQHSKIKKPSKKQPSKETNFNTCSKDIETLSSINNEGSANTCEKCHRTLGNKGAFVNHSRFCTGELKCPKCKRKFINRVRLQVHLRSHVGIKPFKCPTCEQTFTRADTLQHHYKTHLPSRKKFDCIPCQASFLGDMTKHYKSSGHLKAINFIIDRHECPVCDQQFRTAADVYIHMRIHTNNQD